MTAILQTPKGNSNKFPLETTSHPSWKLRKSPMEPSPSKFQVPHSGSHDRPVVSPAIIMAFMEDMHGDQDDLIIIMCFYWPVSDISWNCSQCHVNRATVQSEPADRGSAHRL